MTTEPVVAQQPRVHDLKIWPEFLEPIIDGTKRVELRRNDRDYRAGDQLILREFHVGQLTGRAIRVDVTHVHQGGSFGLHHDFAALSIEHSAVADIPEVDHVD